MTTEIVRARGLRRDFPPSTVALVDATFDIEVGESVAVTGRSGSGKTTLLSLLGLLDTPSAGDLAITGIATEALDDEERTRMRREHIGFVFQAFHLIPHLTALENVAHALEIRGHATPDARRTAAASLDDVGLSARADAYPMTLSGGELQRVAIARALAPRPSLVLCDEPTGNLDRANADVVLELLRGAVTPASAVVVVTHDPSVAWFCDRRLVVNDGRLEAG